jgi:hypothetical protein
MFIARGLLSLARNPTRALSDKGASRGAPPAGRRRGGNPAEPDFQGLLTEVVVPPGAELVRRAADDHCPSLLPERVEFLAQRGRVPARTRPARDLEAQAPFQAPDFLVAVPVPELDHVGSHAHGGRGRGRLARAPPADRRADHDEPVFSTNSHQAGSLEVDPVGFWCRVAFCISSPRNQKAPEDRDLPGLSLSG